MISGFGVGPNDVKPELCISLAKKSIIEFIPSRGRSTEIVTRNALGKFTWVADAIYDNHEQEYSAFESARLSWNNDVVLKERVNRILE